jgi:MYXO-CTERM domain-containing protein
MSRGPITVLIPVFVTITISFGILTPSTAAGANITESFTQAANPSTTGSTLGQCAQLTVGLAANGSVSVPGNGDATISTPAAVDAAILYSTHKLPAAGYTVSVGLTNIYYDKYGQENGVTLLALADVTPQTGTETWWSSHRLIGVEANVYPGGGPNHPLFITYWSATAMYTWNGSAWATGPGSYTPVLIYDPSQTYTVELQKGGRASSYTVRIRSGGNVLAQASVPVSSVKPASSEYLVVGDRLTDAFRGFVDITEVTMPAPPGCSITPSDGGPPPPDSAMPPDSTVSPDTTVPPDAGPPDTVVTPDAAVVLDGPTPDAKVQTDSPAAGEMPGVPDTSTTDGNTPGSEGPVPSWDLSTPDLGATTPGGDESGCECEVQGRSSPGWASLLVLLLLALALGRRR